MSLTFKPTRSEVIKLNRLLSIAQRSAKLLQEKYQLLNEELMRTRDELKKMRLDTEGALLGAYDLVNEAGKNFGEDRLRRAADTFVDLDEISVSWENIKGVLVPKSIYSEGMPPIGERGYYLAETGPVTDRASDAMHEMVLALIRYADLVNRMNILSRELKKIEVRYKALDYVFIPRLLAQKRSILIKLDEMEREDLVRLKRVKEFLETKGTGGPS